MFRRLIDQWWAWKRQRAEETLARAYLRTAPKGALPSADPGINAHYARLREKQPQLTPMQLAALRVQQETLARANNHLPSPKDTIVEERSDHHGGGNMGHFKQPTVRVTGMLPPIKGSDE